MQSCKQGMSKGYHLSIDSIRKGYLFRKKWYIKGREICHLGLWKSPKGLTDKFYGFINSRKRYIFVTDTYLKDSVFTAVKRDAVCERGTNFNRRYAKGVPVSQRFSWKAVYKRVRGWTSGRSLPSWTFVDTHPHLRLVCLLEVCGVFVF